MSASVLAKLGLVMRDLYIADKPLFEELLVTGTCHIKTVRNLYGLFIRDGSCKPISELSEDKRKKLWERAKKLAAGRLDNDDCIELSKALHTLDLLSDQ